MSTPASFSSPDSSFRSDLAQLRHDLRTPINQIVGYCELLMEEGAHDAGMPARVDDLRKIHRAAGDLLGLINRNLAEGRVTLVPWEQVPARAAVSAAGFALPSAELPPARPSARPGRILVVDDNLQNRLLLAQQLGRRGHVLTLAESGTEALQRLRSAEFDLVLLDMVMPGLDGYQTLREIKRDAALRELPVIMISAHDDLAGIGRCIESGAEDYLAKPINQVLLHARIGAGLEKKRLRDQETVFQSELEEAHRRLAAEFEQKAALVEQLSAANEAKNRFLGMAAHDLRNPLASVRGLADFLQRGVAGPVNAGQIAALQSIREASNAMFDQVNELLDVATIESGELQIVRQPHDFGALVEKSVTLANLEAAKKRTRIEYFEPASAASLPVDAAKIRQVIDNLLSNAVKYSPPGALIGALVEIDATRGCCRFMVRDQGPGIAEHERDRLFKDFSRLSAQPTAGEKSTGLGLAICRRIVEAHRGTIGVQNLASGGCEFRVTLPLQP